MKYIIFSVAILCASAQIAVAQQGIEFIECPDQIILCAPNGSLSVPANNQSVVGENAPGATNCSSHVTLSRSVTTECGLLVNYVVDLFPFGSSQPIRLQDTSEAFLNTAQVANVVLNTAANATIPFLTDGLPYNTACLDDTAAFHRLVWRVYTECGDSATCSVDVRIEDCLGPEIEGVMPTPIEFDFYQEAIIAAGDLLISAVDDCSPSNRLLYSFREDVFEPIRTYNCDSINANDSDIFQLEVWAADQGFDRNCDGQVTWDERAKNMVNVLVLFEEDCEGLDFDGLIRTPDLTAVPDATVSFIWPENTVTDTTTIIGGYRVRPSVDTSASVVIIPSKLGDEPEGLSTLDLIKIQKHLLGIEEFSNPYDYIAADANNSASVSTLDLVEIQKVILRISSRFTNNTSWRFVPLTHVFNDPNRPWPFPEVSDLDNLDFVGIKVGDVNYSFDPDAIDGPEDPLDLDLQTRSSEKFVRLDVYMPQGGSLSAIQGTFDHAGLELMDVRSGALDMDWSHFGRHNGATSFCWYDVDGDIIPTDSPLFTLQFRKIMGETIDLTSSRTRAMAVIGNGTDIDPVPLRASAQTAAGLISHSVNPNPFSWEAVLSFQSNRDDQAVLSIFDASGRMVRNRVIPAIEGGNTHILNRSDFPGGGLYFYRIDTAGGSVTGKFLLSEG